MTIPLGGVLVLVAVVLLARSGTSTRTRVGVMVLAVSGLAIAECGYLWLVRNDRSEHEALLEQRKRLCEGVASDLVHHEGWFLRGPHKFPLGERGAALFSLESEVSVTWRMCVRKESACGAIDPAVVLDGERDKLDMILRCYKEGPTPLEVARLFLQN